MMLKHDVRGKQKERDKIAAQMAEYEARKGPVKTSDIENYSNLVSISEAAHYLKVKRATVTDAIANGYLQKVERQGVYFVNRESLEKYSADLNRKRLGRGANSKV